MFKHNSGMGGSVNKGLKFRQTLSNIGFAIAFIVVLVILMFGPLMVRWHGIWSCEDRDGRPIANNILSEQMWDVSCLEP